MVRRAALVALAFALLAPAAAAESGNPDRHRLGWHETMRVQGKVAMTFAVAQVHFQLAAWSAEIEFHNRSARTMRIRPQFALLLSRSRTSDRNLEALLVRRSRPALPELLKPGERWHGVVSGPGRPRSGAWVRFNFGFYVVSGLFRDRSRGFAWITDHAFRVEPRA